MTRQVIGRVLAAVAAMLILSPVIHGRSMPIGTAIHPSASWLWSLTTPGGFGPCDPMVGCDNVRVSSLQAYGGQLYAGTANALGAEIWQFNGSTWHRQVQGGLGDPQNSVIASLAVHDGKLYAGTQQSESAGAEVWSYDGLTWTRTLTGGFDQSATPDQPRNTVASALASFNGRLYIGTRYDYLGAQIWAYDGLTVTQVVSNGLANADNVAVVSMIPFAGSLYAGTLNYRGADLWRTTDGLQWTRAMSNGFNTTANIAVSALGVMSNTLFAATENSETGAQVWRSSDGSTWERILSNGFGSSHFYRVNRLVAYKGLLYAAVSHDSLPQAEVWVYNGQTWDRAVSGGLTFDGQLHTFSEAKALAVLDDTLYLGTSEARTGSIIVGPEVWSSNGPSAAPPTATPTPPPATTATATPSPSPSAIASATATMPPAATPTRTATPTTLPGRFAIFLPIITK
jgi:hypothetical protein